MPLARLRVMVERPVRALARALRALLAAVVRRPARRLLLFKPIPVVWPRDDAL
jgi:hypothetical protein